MLTDTWATGIGSAAKQRPDDSAAALRAGGLLVRAVTAETVTRAEICAWSELEQRAIEANAYLSPHFILPALRHLDPGAPVRILLVQAPSCQTLYGVGVFELAPPNRDLPLPHLRAYRSRHSFLGGLLIDRDHAQAAIGALLDHFTSADADWHGVVIERLRIQGRLTESLALQAAARRIGMSFNHPSPRAVLFPSGSGNDYLATRLGKRLRRLDRSLQRLHRQGRLRWDATAGSAPAAAFAERHLDLEHLGWKRAKGSSLRSAPNQERFFRDMIAGFASEHRALFTELRIDGRCIASTSNLISGQDGFAFKVGYDPAYGKLSPGILNEIEFIRHAPQVCAGLECIDSGASPGGFIDRIWLDRRQVATCTLATTRLGRLAVAATDQLRQLKRALSGRA